jgi:hypothetical protein
VKMCANEYANLYLGTKGFMKIGTDVEGILRFRSTNLKGCNVGITDGWDL